MSDSGLKSIVADLYALRYKTADIARLLGRGERAVRNIIEDLYPRPMRPDSIDDLPADMHQRVLLWKQQTADDVPNRQIEETIPP